MIKVIELQKKSPHRSKRDKYLVKWRDSYGFCGEKRFSTWREANKYYQHERLNNGAKYTYLHLIEMDR